MKNKRILFIVIFIAFLLSLLPVYPAVYEVRSYMIDGTEELSRELSFGSMADLVKDYKYVQRAWDERLVPLNIFLTIISIAFCLIAAWYLSSFILFLWKKIKEKYSLH